MLAAGSEPPYVKLPDLPALFERRAKRFSLAASASPIAGYLMFLAQVSEAQGRIAATIPAPPLPDSVGAALAHGLPPLPRHLADAPQAERVLEDLLAALSAAALPEGPAAIVAGLAALASDERRRLLHEIADGMFEVERLAHGALVAAALQVWFARHAAQLAVADLRNLGERICPCCGGAPVASMVVAWPEAPGSRYLACGLCCAMWNHVRVKCTGCGATKGIAYQSVEGSTGDIAAEICETCQGYAKHLVQTKNAALDPVADDVASYGLDLMLREQGWRRIGLNPFLISA